MSNTPNNKRILLVLDLNGTLLDRISKPGSSSLSEKRHQHLPDPAILFPDYVINKQKVYLRPFLDTFLSTIFQHFHVAAWTSATTKNMVPLVEQVFGEYRKDLVFAWDRNYCTLVPDSKTFESIKDLRKIWEDDRVFSAKGSLEKLKFSETNTILLDDTDLKSRLTPRSSLSIPSYLVTDGQKQWENDTTLLHVLAYLTELSKNNEAPSFDVRDYLEQNALYIAEEPIGNVNGKAKSIEKLMETLSLSTSESTPTPSTPRKLVLHKAAQQLYASSPFAKIFETKGIERRAILQNNTAPKHIKTNPDGSRVYVPAYEALNNCDGATGRKKEGGEKKKRDKKREVKSGGHDTASTTTTTTTQKKSNRSDNLNWRRKE